jgi:hypothetical protein
VSEDGGFVDPARGEPKKEARWRQPVTLDEHTPEPPPVTATRGTDWKRVIQVLAVGGLVYLILSEEKPARRSKSS